MQLLFFNKYKNWIQIYYQEQKIFLYLHIDTDIISIKDSAGELNVTLVQEMVLTKVIGLLVQKCIKIAKIFSNNFFYD